MNSSRMKESGFGLRLRYTFCSNSSMSINEDWTGVRLTIVQTVLTLIVGGGAGSRVARSLTHTSSLISWR